MPARIVAATLRDLSYIASNLRPEDRTELECQFEAWSPAWLAAISLRGPAYCVLVNGNPEAAFGAVPTVNPGLWIAWSWGTRRMWRAVPRITDFVKTVLIPDLYAQGCQRCEARAMVQHRAAHRWLIAMGATECATLDCYGRNGEDFILYAWTRRQQNVLFSPHAISTEPEAASGSAVD